MNSKRSRQSPRPPGSLSPSPLRELAARQPAARRMGLVGLFAVLMLCGGQAPWGFALGAAAGWAALDAGTAIQALAFPETAALREGSAPVLSQLAVRFSHSATAALIAASGSLTLRAGEQE